MVEHEGPHINEPQQDEIEFFRKDCETMGVGACGDLVPSVWMWGQGWALAYDRKTDMPISFKMDEKDLRERPKYARRAALHEWSHFYESGLEYVASIMDQLGGPAINNFGEDNAIENDANAVHSDGKRIIKDGLDYDVAPGGGLDADGCMEINRKKLGYVPKHMIYGAVMRQYFYGREMAAMDPETADKALLTEEDIQKFTNAIEDTDIRYVFEKTREAIEKMYKTVAGPHASEERKDFFKKQRADIIINDIWPHAKRLVEESVEDQAMRNFFKDMMDANGGNPPTVIFVPPDKLKEFFESLPDDVKKEMEEQMDENKNDQDGAEQSMPDMPGSAGGDKGKPQQSQQGQPSGSGGSEHSEESGGKDKAKQDGGADSGGQSESGDAASEDSGEQGTSSGSSSGTGVSSEKKMPDYTKLSEKSKNALKDTFDKKLSDEQKSKYKSEAEGDLADAEQDVVDKTGAHNDKPGSADAPKLTEKYKKSARHQAQDSQKNETGDSEGNEGEKQGNSEESGDGKKTDAQSSEQKKGDAKKSDTKDKSDKKEVGPDRIPATPKPLSPQEKADAKKYWDAIERMTGAKNECEAVLREPQTIIAVDALSARLRPILRKQTHPEIEYSIAGEQYDVDRDIASETDPTIVEIMYTEGQPLKISQFFDFLDDCSTSMDGDKKIAMFRQNAILASSLTRLGIPIAGSGYTDSFPNTVVPFLPDDFVRAKRMRLNHTDMKNLSKILSAPGGSTPTSEALGIKFAEIELRQQKLGSRRYKHYFLLLFTDGSPDEGVDAASKNIKKFLEKSAKLNMNVHLLGFGLGAGSEMIDQLLPPPPPLLRQKIAIRLNQKGLATGYGKKIITPDDVTNLYLDYNVLTAVFDLYIQHAILRPKDFL